MGFIESFEPRTVRTTGGIFKAEDLPIYQRVAKGLLAINEHVTLTVPQAKFDDLGMPLAEDKIRVIINSPGGLSNFWTVAEQARKYRDEIEKDEGLQKGQKTRKINAYISHAIRSLNSQLKRE